MIRNSWFGRSYRFLADSRRNRVLALLLGAVSLVLAALALVPKSPGGSPTTVNSGASAPGGSAITAPTIQLSTGPGAVNAAGNSVVVNSGLPAAPSAASSGLKP